MSINSLSFVHSGFNYFIEYSDRMGSYWQSVQDHLYNLIVNATENTFLTERAVVGLLRLAIRLLRRDEIASQVRGLHVL